MSELDQNEFSWIEASGMEGGLVCLANHGGFLWGTSVFWICGALELKYFVKMMRVISSINSSSFIVF